MDTPPPVQALEKLVHVFARHKEECAVMADDAPPQARCTCGLSAQHALVRRALERPR